MTVTELGRTALLVIDVQNDVVAHAHNRTQVLDNITALVANARAAGSPVIWVQHHDDEMPRDTEGWSIAPELDPRPDEPIVHKSLRSSFDDTTLESVLEELGVTRLVVAGSQTDFCVRWTLHGALHHGYDTALVSDAHTTDDPPTDALPSAAQTIALLNNIWASQETSGPATSVVSTEQVTF